MMGLVTLAACSVLLTVAILTRAWELDRAAERTVCATCGGPTRDRHLWCDEACADEWMRGSA